MPKRPTRKKITVPPPSPFNGRLELERLMKGLSGHGAQQGNPVHAAQELAYDAMQETNSTRRLQLIRQSLELDPNNVDSQLLLIDAAELEGEERIKSLRCAVVCGEKGLGPAAIKEMVPRFWGIIETRPYMRARGELAAALLKAGRYGEAAKEYAEMLELNENDNQGARYELLPLLLMDNRLDEARRLEARYPDEVKYNAVFAWCEVLVKFVEAGASGAAMALAGARTVNPHMEGYIIGKNKIPKDMANYYQPGSKEEAACYADQVLLAWKAHPAAVEWLVGRAGRA
jgi:tetratricopeptide (TPR) repeat protein